MPGERTVILATLGLASALAISMARSRSVWRLGSLGKELAPGWLFLAWLSGLYLGQWTGSLAGMSLAATATLLAVWLGSTRSRSRFGGLRWTVLDWIGFAVLAAFVLVVRGGDDLCHYTMVSTYLRGNVPPRALNDPSFPLIYHGLYDGLAATFVRGLHVDLELGLDLATTLLVGLTMCNLQVVSRALFDAPAARQWARLFFLFGTGPVFVPLLASADLELSELHGKTFQSLPELLLRRPMALSLFLFTFALAALLPHYRSRVSLRRGGTGHVHPVFLLPLAMLLPVAAEELVFLVTVLLVPLLVRRQFPVRWAAIALVLVIAGAAGSGVFRGVLDSSAPMARPQLALARPALPSWAAPHDGLPLASTAALRTMMIELGPIVLVTVCAVLFGRDARRRALVILMGTGLAAGSVLTLKGWPRADLDRFLFHGALCGFALTALWIERSSATRSVSLRVLVALLIAATTGSAVALAGQHMVDRPRQMSRMNQEQPGAELRRVLSVVGPREVILTDAASAQLLILSGFLVLAPLDSHMVGRVNMEAFDAYVSAHAARADWLWLLADDPRVRARQVVARHAGYALVEARH